MVNNTRKSFAPAKLALSVAVALAALSSASASAFVILDNDTGQLRLDTTVRYNLGWRMSGIDPVFANNFGTDETATVFKKHDLITNRLDVLVESDYIGKYENGLNYGARISGAAWHEMAYPSHSKTNPEIDSFFTGIGFPPPPSNYGPGGQWSSYAKRYVTGSSGELLDAFVFSGFQLGGTNLNVKLGKHTIAWGEANFNDGINVGQAPVDAIKGQASPGSQTKELFRPINQLSLNWALNPEWSVIGNYQFEWQPTHNVPGGTFFAAADGSGDLWGHDPYCAGTAPGTCIQSLDAITPNKNGGSYGLGARWSPAWWDGTMGFYYRHYDELTPWASLQLQAASPLPGIRLSYARDTELLGFSGTHNMFGFLNVGVDLSYRRNTALNSTTFLEGTQGGAAPAIFANLSQTPSYDQVEGARGNTYHLVVNAISLLDRTFWYETGTAVFELGYQRLDKVTKNPTLFNSVGYACDVAGLNKGDGCSTKDSLAGNILFSPQWMAVLPSVDLTMPTSLTYGIFGNSPVNGGNSNYGAYSWSIGLNAKYRNTYEFGALFAGKHHNYKTKVGTGATALPGQLEMSTSNGPQANLNSHRWFGLNFKTTF